MTVTGRIAMKALTLHQPWASLIAIGAKPFETRSWAPPASVIGQRIAIHAAARAPRLQEIADLMNNPFTLLADTGAFELLKTWWGTNDGLPFGAVVCTAILAAAYQCGDEISPGQVEVVKAVGPADHPVTIPVDPFGDYSPGRWAWLLEDVEPLPKPIPATGKQGFWNLSHPIFTTTGEQSYAV